MKYATRPADMPDAERWPHGVRARYVGGCRCDECKAANASRCRERTRKMNELAGGVVPSGPPLEGVLVRAGRAVRVKRCPGANGKPCACKEPTWLRGQGVVCGRCLEIATVFDGLVSAGRVRQHLRKLARQGVGYKSVAAACDVAPSTLSAVLADASKKLRARTAAKILAVTRDAMADGARVSSSSTKLKIKRLLEEGFTKRELARRLGYQSRTLQIGTRTMMLASTELRFARFYRQVMA
jgi:hypothetical protein